MSGHCPGCGDYCEEDDQRLCRDCVTKARIAQLERQLADATRRAEEQDARWKEIVADELACTCELMEALGVVQEVKGGRAVQPAMLDAIAKLTRRAEAAEEAVKLKDYVLRACKSFLDLVLHRGYGTPHSMGDQQSREMLRDIDAALAAPAIEKAKGGTDGR